MILHQETVPTSRAMIKCHRGLELSFTSQLNIWGRDGIYEYMSDHARARANEAGRGLSSWEWAFSVWVQYQWSWDWSPPQHSPS